jgi:hypothetical protein
MTKETQAAQPPADATKATPRKGYTIGQRGKTDGVYVGVFKGGSSDHRRGQVSISIFSGEMKKMRWLIGDRVEVLMSNQYRELWVRRAAVAGYMLSANGSLTGEARKKAKGTTAHSNVKFATPAGWAIALGDKFRDCKVRTEGDWLVVTLGKSTP